MHMVEYSKCWAAMGYPLQSATATAWDGLVTKKNLRVEANFDEILKGYFSIQLPVIGGKLVLMISSSVLEPSGEMVHYLEPPEAEEGLQQFSNGLQNLTKFHSFQELATLTYGDQTSNCCIVSSIEFDRDGEFFAVAGVTKKIKVSGCFKSADNTCGLLRCLNTRVW